MNNDIKVLLFDLGGVVIDIDPKKAISELKKISSKTVTEFKELDYRYETFNSDLSKLFNAYEKGEISDQVFRNGLRTAGNLDLDDKKIDASADRHPLKEIGSPEQVAKTARFLLDAKENWITGQIVNQDGGMSTLK